MNKMLGLYIHIPFCKQKCVYCDFNSYSDLTELFDFYTQALCSEIKRTLSACSSRLKVSSIYFGGGTPTILPFNLLELILETCFSSFKISKDIEIIIEANPETLDPYNLGLLKKIGFNRLSIGFQSLNDSYLKLLGRKHTAKRAKEGYFFAREAGFSNINIDLIYGLPEQNLNDWEGDLREAVKLEPDHISAYCLEVHPETPLALMIKSGILPEIDEDLQADMHMLTCEYLNSTDLQQYEISNFSKPGFECRHNLTYWKNESYLGFGAGAHSHFNHCRFRNVFDPCIYINLIQKEDSAAEEYIRLTSNEQIAETVFLNLRLIEGLKNQEFKKRFGKDLDFFYGEQIERFSQLGLLSYNDTLKLTPKGLLLANQVLSEFV